MKSLNNPLQSNQQLNILIVLRYDSNNDKKLDLEELKIMMEKLKVPQTHLGLKDMIRQVDEDQDNKINFKEVY